MIVAEALRALSVDVHRISAHVFVVVVTAVFVIVVVVVVVVAVAVVIAAVVVATVPRRISVVRSTVINDCRTMPSTVPTAVPPAAASAAHHCADRDSCAESNDPRGNHSTSGRGDVGIRRHYV